MLLINIYLNMKKLIFGAAALLFTGAMMAQTPTFNLPAQSAMTDIKGDSSVDATEVAHLAGDTYGNSGESIQNGNTNKVQVLQAGTNNSVYTNQADGLGLGDNKAKIWQTGDVNGNYFNDSGYRNVADVQQRGTDNQAEVGQEGDTNEAVVKQGMKEGTLGLSEGNKAYINHGIAENGETNYAMIEQDGMDNSAKTVQTHDNSEARTVQEGDDNIADIRQEANPNQTEGHSALAEQYGDDNVTKIRQYGAFTNTAHSVQFGDDNKSNQKQWSGPNSGNRADVNQGAANIINTNLYTSIHDNGLLAVDDIANGSFAPGSYGGKALQIQSGDDNEAYLEQFGSSAQIGNVGEQRQYGANNDAYLVQNEYGNPNGGANYARQDQDGDDNVAGIGQNGTDHLAYQRQIGNNNSAMSTQRGDYNRVSTYQGGDNNILETGQRGTNNTILLVQKQESYFPGHSYKVSQNLPGGTPVGMPNGGNIADILQLGPGGGVGEGCDFQVPTPLDCPTGLGDFDIANPCDASVSGC